MVKHVIQEPHATLRQTAKPCTHIQAQAAQNLIRDLRETMITKRGVGIAAPQINESTQIIIVETNDGPLALYNPRIRKYSRKKVAGEEGCLSLVGVYGLVSRALSVEVDAIDEHGDVVHIRATDFFARVLQHEVDHLNGILFIDRASKITQGKELLRSAYAK